MISVRRKPFWGLLPPGEKTEELSIETERTCSVARKVFQRGVGRILLLRREEYCGGLSIFDHLHSRARGTDVRSTFCPFNNTGAYQQCMVLLFSRDTYVKKGSFEASKSAAVKLRGTRPS